MKPRNDCGFRAENAWKLKEKRMVERLENHSYLLVSFSWQGSGKRGNIFQPDCWAASLRRTSSVTLVNLYFPVLGSTLPGDHLYALYSALSHVVMPLHGRGCPIQIGPILGDYVGQRQRRLDPKRSRLRLRLPAEEIPT